MKLRLTLNVDMYCIVLPWKPRKGAAAMILAAQVARDKGPSGIIPDFQVLRSQ